MGTPLGPKYIPYTYMDPLGKSLPGKMPTELPEAFGALWPWHLPSEMIRVLGFRVYRV